MVKEMVQITRREQRLRERLLTVDEDVIHDEKRLHDNGRTSQGAPDQAH